MPAEKRARIAVIGLGLIGRRHLTVLLESGGYEVAGVADPSPQAETFARESSLPYFAAYEEMLERARPDGAIVATPNQLHVPVGLACIRRGIPILVEKPIADSVEGASELVEAAEREGVPILTGHHRRHNPLMRRAAELIRGGGIGKVTAATAIWLSRKPDDYFDLSWRREPGGGPILINAIHEVDCLRMLCGEIETVQAATSDAARSFPVEDTAAAVFRFEGGALGTLILSDATSTPWSWEWASYENPFYPHQSENCYLVAGTRGAVSVPTLDHWWHEPGEGWGHPLTRRRQPVRHGDAYVEQMRNFAAVIAGEETPVVSGREGLKTLAATLAIKRSAAEGRLVRPADMLPGGAAQR